MAEQMLAEVEYRDIPQFKGYRVGSDGSVWSQRRSSEWRRLKPVDGKYLKVGLGPLGGTHRERKLYAVHILVLEVFIGPRPEGMQACHNNGNRTDNRLKNLRWDTAIANRSDMRAHGTLPIGELHSRAKLTADSVRIARQMRFRGASYKTIGDSLGVDPSTAWQAINGRSWNHVA